MASDPISRSAAGSPAANLAPVHPRISAVLARLGRLGPLAEMTLVAGAILALALLLTPLAWLLNGPAGLAALAIAAAGSLVAALLALIAGWLFRGPQAPMYGTLAGMLVRMSVALAVVVLVKQGRPDLAGVALVFYLLVFYVVALTIETAMLIGKIMPDRRPSGSDRSNQILPKAV
jgi:hypothetical protein